MCEVGDIIVVNGYRNNDGIMKKHSFIVINDEGGKIQGLDYEVICNVMSSFQDEEHKKRKLNHPCNVPISATESTVVNGNTKDGYIKSDQLYYFNKKTKYWVIGKVNPEVLERLFNVLRMYDFPIIKILDNL